MRMNPEPTTVGALVTRMRRMAGHLGNRDKRTMLDAVEAILELNERAYKAEHLIQSTIEPERTRDHVTITRAAEAEPDGETAPATP